MQRKIAETGAHELFDSIAKESGEPVFVGLSLDEIEAARNLVIPLLLGSDNHPGGLKEVARWMTHLASPYLQAVPPTLRPLLVISSENVINSGEEAKPVLEQFLAMRLGALGFRTLPKERHKEIAAASSSLFIRSCAELGLVHQEK